MPNAETDIQSGAGGYIEVNSQDDSTGNFNRFDVSRWELIQDPQLIQRTNTTPRTKADGSKAKQIGTRYRATVPDPSWKIELPWDNNNVPDAYGLIMGAEINLILHMGEPDPLIGNIPDGWILWHTTLGPVEVFDDSAKDVVRVILSGKGGDLTDLDGNEIIPTQLPD